MDRLESAGQIEQSSTVYPALLPAFDEDHVVRITRLRRTDVASETARQSPACEKDRHRSDSTCSATAAQGADLVIDLGAGVAMGNVDENEKAPAVRTSVGLDLFGIVEPVLVATWALGHYPGYPLFNQEGGLVFHGFAGMLRVHTPPPHQVFVGAGLGSGQLVALQQQSSEYGYRGTAGAYTVFELGYRYSASRFVIGLSLTAHRFTNVYEIGDFAGATSPQPSPPQTCFAGTAFVGLRLPVF